jgi:HK97 family phage prohead protease
MNKLEWKDFTLDLKLDDDTGEFEAYFAAFGNVDLGNDILEKGAVANIADFLKSGWIGVNHNVYQLPVAYPTAAKQDDTGLLIAGKFHGTAAGQECRTVIKERRAAGLKVRGSIGYKVNDSAEEKIKGQYIRRLKSIAVWECSFVNLAMNPKAELVSAKSLDPDAPKLLAIDDLKSLLEEFKAGRVISKTNYNKLKDMHAKLGDAHATLGAFLDQHDPDGGIDEPDDDALVGGGGRVKGLDARFELLRLRVLRGRMKAISPHGVKP